MNNSRLTKLLKVSTAVAAISLGLAMVQTAYGQASNDKYYSLTEQPLDIALNTFASENNINIIYDPALVKGKSAPLVKGHFTVNQALTALLKGSGLSIERKGENTYFIHFQKKSKATSQGDSDDQGARAENNESPLDFEKIVVTGTKKLGGVSVHDAALAVTAISGAQLEQAHIRDLSNIADLVPNVLLNGTGTFPGTATFSIRGMAINNSIPSNTPTVGTFVDGIYIGVASGIVLDNFDLEGVEVLRGPQGLLFGRNVTGGAVLQKTTLPTDTLKAKFRASVETGLNFTESGVISGPLGENVNGKIAVYRNDDSGWFHNSFDGKRFGKSKSNRINAAVSLMPHSDFRTILRMNYGNTEGDGSAVQNHGVFSRNSFDFDINTTGYIDIKWTQLSAETTKDVSFGEGQIVNILGYREVSQRTLTDFDGTPESIFTLSALIHQHQISDELRYSGVFGRLSVTAGLYYYTDRLFYVEQRDIRAGSSINNLVGGGQQKSNTYAAFSAFDFNLGHGVTLNLGARYSIEDKTASIDRLQPKYLNGCSIQAENCISFGFNDSHSWNSFTPKIGFQWNPTEQTNLYAFWTKGNRSGGYNLRQGSTAAPGPYNMETESAFEAGIKNQLLDNRLNINLAGFINKFKDLQRDISRTDPILGSVQSTINTADATIKGLEAEMAIYPVKGLALRLQGGYLDSKFNKILYDLSGNGSVGPEDYKLELPLLSPWSYGANVMYSHAVTNGGELSGRVAYNHRDRSFGTDNNRGFLNAVNYINADISYLSAGGMSVSLYGKNLTNQVFFGVDVPLPFTPGETHSPLSKGRIIGLELRYAIN